MNCTQLADIPGIGGKPAIGEDIMDDEIVSLSEMAGDAGSYGEISGKSTIIGEAATNGIL